MVQPYYFFYLFFFISLSIPLVLPTQGDRFPPHLKDEGSSLMYDDQINDESFYRLEHPHTAELLQNIQYCHKDPQCCDEFGQVQKIYSLAAKITNQHSALLIIDQAKLLFRDIFYYLDQSRSCRKLSAKICHILYLISFSIGEVAQSVEFRKCLNESDLISVRSMIAQSIIHQNESEGLRLLDFYSQTLKQRLQYFFSLIPTETVEHHIDFLLLPNSEGRKNEFFSNEESKKSLAVSHRTIEYVYPTVTKIEDIQEFILSFLLSEMQGGIRTSTKIFDLPLSFMNFTLFLSPDTGSGIEDIFTEKLRFRLGIGLAKLGLYELSLKHVSQAAAGWQSPLYRLRSKLIFNSIHSSIGSLAIAINQFEKNIESILLSSMLHAHVVGGSDMSQVCNSPNEAALAFQSLPLLHLLGYSSPRIGHSLGHSPIPLPVLLGEVYMKICPPLSQFNETYFQPRDAVIMYSDIIPERKAASSLTSKPRKNNKIRLGIVAGTFDGITGRLMIGLFAGLSEHPSVRDQFEIIALCFPTARSIITDKVNSLFDDNINLSPENKTKIIERVIQSEFDFLLFMDAALDARVFALAHERLATFQGLFWTYGGTLGIPSIDYYFIPELLWTDSRCPRVTNANNNIFSSSHSSGSAALAASSASLSYYNHHHSSNNYQLPQELYHEQVVFLDGIPFLPRVVPITPDEVRATMKSKYLLDISNRTNVYLLPISIKYLHPEFDKSLEVILRTDPRSMIIITAMRSGRDSLPTTHLAIRHDLMHPAMPIAAVMKLKKRFSSLMKDDYSERIHILPPLDEPVFRALQLQSVALLDTYPVGLHTPIIEGILDGVPIISLPFLQECTNSHAINLQKAFNISYYLKLQKKLFYFTTPEEYGVLAVQLSKDTRLRKEMIISPETAAKLSYKPKEDTPSPSKSLHNQQQQQRDDSVQFTQYYQQHHHFIQILRFISQLKAAFVRS